MQCPQGYGRAVVDSVETCAECEVGYYSDTVDNSTCNSCPTDFGITNGRGAKSITNCFGINILVFVLNIFFFEISLLYGIYSNRDDFRLKFLTISNLNLHKGNVRNFDELSTFQNEV